MTPRSIFDGGRYSSLHRPCQMANGQQMQWEKDETVTNEIEEVNDVRNVLLVCLEIAMGLSQISFFFS